MSKKQHVSFNYPLKFDYDYVFPTRYYLNVTTGHSIIKNEQIKITKPVTVGKDGIIDTLEVDEATEQEEE